jgi:hypothetical protein
MVKAGKVAGAMQGVARRGSVVFTAKGTAVVKAARVTPKASPLSPQHKSTADRVKAAKAMEKAIIEEISEERDSIRKQHPHRKLDNSYITSPERQNDLKSKREFKRKLNRSEDRYKARVKKNEKAESESAANRKIWLQELESEAETAERIIKEAKEDQWEETKARRKRRWRRINSRVIAAPIFSINPAKYCPAFDFKAKYHGEPDGKYEALVPVPEFLARELPEKEARAASRLLEYEYENVGQLRDEWRNASHKLCSHLAKGKDTAAKLRLQMLTTPVTDFITGELYDLDTKAVCFALQQYGTVAKLHKHWVNLEKILQKQIGFEATDRIATSWIFHLDDPPDPHAWGGHESTPGEGMSLSGAMMQMAKLKKWGKRAQDKVETAKKTEMAGWDAAIQKHVEQKVLAQVKQRRDSRIKVIKTTSEQPHIRDKGPSSYGV